MRGIYTGNDGVRRVITDEVWYQIQAVLTQILSKRGAPPVLSNREFLEAVLYQGRAGSPWRDLPKVFGDWNTVYKRFRYWQEAGIWERFWRALHANAATDARALFIDSTIIRVHQHAAGGGSNIEEAKGRSRGGMTTKIHLAAVDEKTAVSVVISEGQAADCMHFDEIMNGVDGELCPAKEVVADKGYDTDDIRESLAASGMTVTIPGKENRIKPILYDKKKYKERNMAERLNNRLKRMRRVATRYDKLASVFLAFVHIAFAFSILI